LAEEGNLVCPNVAECAIEAPIPLGAPLVEQASHDRSIRFISSQHSIQGLQGRECLGGQRATYVTEHKVAKPLAEGTRLGGHFVELSRERICPDSVSVGGVYKLGLFEPD
jgi:hypothetical protein